MAQADNNVTLLLETIEHLTEHLELDGELVAVQKHKSALAEELNSLQLQHEVEAAKVGVKGFEQQAYEATSENCELKLQLLKWRKRVAVLRLKLSSVEETVHLQQGYQQASAEAVREVGERNAQLHQCLEEASLSLSQQRLEMGQLQSNLTAALSSNSGLSAQIQEADAQLRDHVDRIQGLEGEISDLQAERADLLQQLEGSQLAAGSALRQAEGLKVQLERSTSDSQRLSLQLSSALAELEGFKSEAAASRAAVQGADARVKVTEQRLRLAEEALESWKALDEDRQRLVLERESQHRILAEERTKLTSDKASVNEVKLQAHTTLLQTQLDNEISLRHRAELSFKQQLLSAQERADVESRRAMMLDDQLRSRHQRIVELEDALRVRMEDTPGRRMDRAVHGVDRILTHLMPVAEEDDDKQPVADDGEDLYPQPSHQPSQVEIMAARAKAQLAASKQTKAPAAKKPVKAQPEKPSVVAPPPATATATADAPVAAPVVPKRKREALGDVSNTAAGSKRGASSGIGMGMEMGDPIEEVRVQEPIDIRGSKGNKAAVTKQAGTKKAKASLKETSLSDHTSTEQPSGTVRVKRAAAVQAKAKLHSQQQSSATWYDSEDEGGGFDDDDDGGHNELPAASGSPDQRHDDVVFSSQVSDAAQKVAASRKVPSASQKRQAAVIFQAAAAKADLEEGRRLMGELHGELDRSLATAGGPITFLSQPLPQLQPLLGNGATWGGSQPPAAAGSSKRESLGFIDRDMLPLFKSRVASDPLATLNARVLEAAAARQGRVSLSAKQALRRMSLGNTTSSLPGGGNSSAIKRKLKAAGGNLALFGGGGGNGGGAGGPGPSDVLPVGLLRDSLKVPKMR